MKFDDVLSIIGDFGTYQRVIFTVLCLPLVFMAMQYMAPVFVMGTPDHRCAIPSLFNDTYEVQSYEHELLIERYIPKDSSGTWSSCKINFSPQNSSENVTSSKSCDRWVYAKTPFRDTVVTELTLVCSRTFYKAHAITASDVGALIGYITLGPVVDKFGRKRGYLLVLFLTSIATTALAWQPNIYVSIGVRAIVGCVSSLVYNTAFIYAVEFIGLSKRTLCGIFLNYFWAAGMLIQTGMAYQLRSWRELQLAMSIPLFGFVFYWWIIPESPRWLITHGKSKEVQTLVMKMAKVNKVKLSKHQLDIEEESENEAGAETSGVFTNLLLTMKDKTIAMRSFIVYLDWLVVSLLYYGLSLNVGNLGGDIYVNYAISSGVEVVAYTVSVPLIWWMGRKKFYCVCMLIGGVSLLASAATDLYGNESLHWVMIALAMVGKMVAAAAYATIYLFTAELFPTVIRSTVINLSSFSGSLGNIVAPYIVILGDVVPGSFAKELPLLIFSVSSIISGLASLVLPETGHEKLPDTIVDIRAPSKQREPNTSPQKI